MDDSSVGVLMYTIPTLATGCSSLKSLLLSTLQCFYSDSDCLSIVLKYIKQIYEFNVKESDWFDVQPLIYNPELSRFPPNTTIFDIIQNVTIEQWTVSFSYENFYYTCAPSNCIYTIYTHRRSLIEIIIIFISSISGLAFLFRFLTPYLITFIKLFPSKINNRHHHHQQQQQQQQQQGKSTYCKLDQNSCEYNS